MSKIVVLNQEIESLNFQGDELFHYIKVEFIKKCILELFTQFIKHKDLPPEFVGFILHMESQVKKADILQFNDLELSRYLERQANTVQQRERLYSHWNSRTPNNKKLSYALFQLNTRLFSSQESSDENKELQAIIHKAKSDLQNKLTQEQISQQKTIILKWVNKAIEQYHQNSFWPIGQQRKDKQHELLLQITNAADATQAMHTLRSSISQIEQQHILESIPANLAFYRRKSRLAAHLNTALHEISAELNLKTKSQKTKIQYEVERAIQRYLDDDIFYHNKNRRYLACQLLLQLQEDANQFPEEKSVQRKYKMRTTLDEYIAKIEAQAKTTHFFLKYTKKHSRLAEQLENIKSDLINTHDLPELELEVEIKAPIIKHIQELTQSLSLAIDTTHEMQTLIQTIRHAQTPHAIEAIIEGHTRSYLKKAETTDWLTTLKHLYTQKTPHFTLALKLEHALLTWQIQGLLPNASGYKTFLQTLGEQREQNENEITQLETQYNIKIPHNLQSLKPKLESLKQKATTLKNRLTKL